MSGETGHGRERGVARRERARVKKAGRVVKRVLARDDCVVLPKYVFVGARVEPSVVVLPSDHRGQGPMTLGEKERVERCRVAIEGAMERYKCVIVPQHVMLAAEIEATVRILPRPS